MAQVKKVPFVPVSVKILEALISTELPSRELRIIMLVWRLTYGWHQKWAEISYNDFSRTLGINRRNCIALVQGLVKNKILKRKQKFKGKLPIYIYKFQKDFDRWKIGCQTGVFSNTTLDKLVSSATPEVVSSATPLLVSSATPVGESTPIIFKERKERKDISLVETPVSPIRKKPKKPPPKPYDQDTPEYKLAELLWQLIKERNNGHKSPKLDKWAKEMELMLRIDKRSTQQAAEVICWAQADVEFWQAVILSPKNLRKHFDRLVAKMKLKPHPRQKGGDEFLRQLKEGGQRWLQRRISERETSDL